MKIGFIENNQTDANGNPTGGTVVGTGFTVAWQNGPLGRGTDRVAPNGAFVEDVIGAVAARLLFYQSSKFNCPENEAAIRHLNLALEALDSRTRRREAQSVEGTHAGT